MANSAAAADLQNDLRHAADTQPTWIVVGTGALGSLWARGLQQAGAPVMVYSRHTSDGPEVELNVVPAAGAAPEEVQDADSPSISPAASSVHSATHTSHKSVRARFPVIHSAAAAPPGAIWLVMVKAWQLEVLLQQLISEYAAPMSTEVVANKGANSAPMQLILSHNGMGAADALLAQAMRVGQVQVYDLVTTHGAWRQSRLSTVHAGLGESWLGPRNAQPQPPAWFHTLEQALPPLRWEANISARRWHKLAINCVINPLATIAGDVNGVLRKDEYQPKIRAICEEIGNLNPNLDADVLVASVQQVIRATANNRCSMLQDSEAGKPTEIDYLNGFICQEGTHLHVATRVNCELWHQLASSNTSKDKNEKE